MRATAQRAAAAPLLALLLAAAAAAAAAVPPDANAFAWRDLKTGADASLEKQLVNTCINGHAVAGIWVVYAKTNWQRSRDNPWVWTHEPGRVDLIRVYSHEKDPSTGNPRYFDIGKSDTSLINDGRQEGSWIALQPLETINRITLRGNGFPGDAEGLGGIKIETSSQTLDVDTWSDIIGFDVQCRDVDPELLIKAVGCPVAKDDRPTVVTDAADRLGLLGSGLLCGFYGTVPQNNIQGINKFPGIKEITPVMLNWVVKSSIQDVQYKQNWQEALGPLQPQVAAAVRIDNRKGQQGSVSIKLTDTTVDSSTTSYTAGSSLTVEKSITVALEVPSGIFKKTGLDFTAAGVWEKGALENKGTVRDITTAAGTSVKTPIGAGAWTQIVFANYKSVYDVPYAGNMALTIENRRLGRPFRTATLSFKTQGRVRGVSTSATRYAVCDLDATGNCPTIPANNTVAPPPDPTAGVPLASSLSDAEVLSAFFVSTPAQGAPGSVGTPRGFRNCLESERYLARIEAVNIGTDWASSIRLWYETGTAGEPDVSVDIGRINSDSTVTSSCTFARLDQVLLATTWDNNRCLGAECRWGKTEFKILRAATGKVETCSIQVKGLVGAKLAGYAGPSQMQNIGSGRLCGAMARSGADVDALGWIFMRDVTDFKSNVQTPASPVTPPAFDTSSSTSVDNRGHAYSVEHGITPFTLTQTVKQTWETTTSESFADKKSTTVVGSLFEILKTTAKYGESYTTSTKTVTGGALTKTTNTEISFTVEVPPYGCTYLQTRQYKNTNDFVSWKGTAALTFDNGRSVALPVEGSMNFATSNVYEIIPTSCANAGNAIRPTRRPKSLVVSLPRAMRAEDLLRALARRFGLRLSDLRALNADLAQWLPKNVKFTITLEPPPGWRPYAYGPYGRRWYGR